MDTQNPYQGPARTESLTPTIGNTYEPRVFALEGRIGRLRYVAYYTASMLVIVPIAVIATVVGKIGGETPAVVLLGVGILAALVHMLALGVRRLNDLNRSGWLLLLMAIPLVNLLLSLYMFFAPGTTGGNNYGPEPTRNGNFVFIGALLMPILAVAMTLYAPSMKKGNAAAVQAEAATIQEAQAMESADAEPQMAEPAVSEPRMAEPAEAAAPAMAAPAYAAPAYESAPDVSEENSQTEDDSERSAYGR
ncbi:MAG: DUF805 domain-containing protein [Fluviicoccus sp.]|uniref:DUF805 domain-containing protein n=1 Tax=Fluviicoccus sp. TaxID=2003552 RepID=UPI00271982D8|nr:DUF805 domain-containing protein [Fluviicoccus sp.]MDO8329359.1 DUF805 domain-containing protein [Fluviicoccus sp.]